MLWTQSSNISLRAADIPQWLLNNTVSLLQTFFPHYFFCQDLRNLLCSPPSACQTIAASNLLYQEVWNILVIDMPKCSLRLELFTMLNGSVNNCQPDSPQMQFLQSLIRQLDLIISNKSWAPKLLGKLITLVFITKVSDRVRSCRRLQGVNEQKFVRSADYCLPSAILFFKFLLALFLLRSVFSFVNFTNHMMPKIFPFKGKFLEILYRFIFLIWYFYRRLNKIV